MSSTDDPAAGSHLHIDVTPSSSSSSAHDFSHFGADRRVPSFKHTLPAQGHSTSTPSVMVMTARGGRGGGGRGEVGTGITGQEIMIGNTGRVGPISGVESEGQKNDFSSSPPTTESISQALYCLQDSSMIMGGGGLPMQLDQLQGLLPHRLPSRGNKPPPNSHHHHHHHEHDGFSGGGDLMSSRDDSSLQVDQSLALRLSGSSGNADCSSSSDPAIGRSLSHPNLSRAGRSGDSSSTAIPQSREVQTSKSTLTHSQGPILTHTQANPPIPFPGNLGSFALSSMMGHFAPQLQPQSLQTAVNPSSCGSDGRSGIMQTLGVSVGSNNRSNSSNISTQSRLPVSSNPPLPSSSVSSILGGGSNPSLSIVNPPVSFNMGGMGIGGGANISMPLAHPIPSNPPNIPLLSGMPTVYSYPYAATLPTQSITSSMVRVNAPGPTGFAPPGQTLAPGGYHQYVPPSLYSNSQQPPVSTGNYTT